MGRVGVLFLVATAVAGTAASARAAQSPQALRASIFAAAQTERSVHYVTASRGPISLRMNCDVAGDRGIQRITFTKHGRTGHVMVRVAHRTAYIRGDAFTLHGYMGFTSAQASRYAGRWISLPHTSSGYKTVAAGVTFSSLLRLLYPHGNPVRVSGTLDGRKVVGVRVKQRNSGLRYIETLWAKKHGTPLPVEEYQVAPSKGYWQRVTMSRWNEPVHVRAPAHAVPISVVTG